MNPRLRALLMIAGFAIAAGTSYWVMTPRPGILRGDLADAGINADCSPFLVDCAARNLCQSTLSDGGLSRRYLTVRVLYYRCPPMLEHVRCSDGGLNPGCWDAGDGLPSLIPRWPRNDAGSDCYEPVGPPGEACNVLGATFDDGGQGVLASVDRCACRPTDAGMCRSPNPDGGALGVPMNYRQTYAAPFAQYTGPSCIRTPCGEMMGEQGQALDTDCQ